MIVAGLIEQHPRHAAAKSWLDKARAAKVQAIISAHSVAEAYSVLSSLPLRPPLDPLRLADLIEDLTSNIARPVSLGAAEYLRTLHRLAADGLRGGIIYDALIAAVAIKEKADRIITWNVRDFRRVWPLDPDLVQQP